MGAKTGSNLVPRFRCLGISEKAKSFVEMFRSRSSPLVSMASRHRLCIARALPWLVMGLQERYYS